MSDEEEPPPPPPNPALGESLKILVPLKPLRIKCLFIG